MLQMPLLQLQQQLRHELATNPLLEEIEELEQEENTLEESEFEVEEKAEKEEQVDWDDFFDDDEGYKFVNIENSPKSILRVAPVFKPRISTTISMSNSPS